MELRKDSNFNEVFNRVGFTGSFYDGLRVAEATEFDLNLILKPKFKMEITKVNYLKYVDLTLRNKKNLCVTYTSPMKHLFVTCRLLRSLIGYFLPSDICAS